MNTKYFNTLKIIECLLLCTDNTTLGNVLSDLVKLEFTDIHGLAKPVTITNAVGIIYEPTAIMSIRLSSDVNFYLESIDVQQELKSLLQAMLAHLDKFQTLDVQQVFDNVCNNKRNLGF